LENKSFLILVTGQSGSGLGTVIRILEDLGFYCIDNLPVELVVPTLDALESKSVKHENKFALGIHIHSLEQANDFEKLIVVLKKKLKVDVLFLMTQDSVLQTRFSTTRRKHPFETEPKDLLSAIQKEREVLTLVEKNADNFIDTTDFSPQDLAAQIEQQYFPDRVPRKLAVTITSFGFKHGVCQPVDTMFDVRFLKNPFFSPKLKEKNGLDKDVINFILSDKETQPFLDKLVDFNKWLIPRYYKEGKHYFRIAIGCTGGKHRSVCVTEILAKHLKHEFKDIIDLTIYHRDISN
jgi:UPF0042 nucleotide-binding protein